jgi:NADH-quinone oxidoreductase subunit G
MSDTITITINDQQVEARPGEMLIDVADANNITIPRFCYHKKLSVAANCRMCLVEVEKAPKPMPACATPVNDGMVVRTKSANAIAAQKSTMEFLLINHPLDCPICDQGGECELQDVAMGFGGDVSQYTEQKRVVCEKNIGPLIATDMTRCIHCTRCVRFGEEIAGLPELGATGRGESTEIGTYIEKSVSSELSGNVIDLCPVGALTAKPSRYTARPWELIQHASVGAHDCVGSNLYVHTRGNQVMRVVPRDNEAINEAWISDRDRFSYSSLKSPARLQRPKIRSNGKLVATEWSTAINLAVEKLQAAANQKGSLAALISPQCTLEEQYLLQKLVAGLGSSNIDHRLNQVDFAGQERMPVMPWLGRSIESLQQLDSALIVGANLRREQPMLNHRIRKAAISKGALIASISSLSGQYNFALTEEMSGNAAQQVIDLACVVLAAYTESKTELPATLQTLGEKARPRREHKAVAKALIQGENSAVIVGLQAVANPDYSLLLQLAIQLASVTGSTLSMLSESANSAGACLAGSLPHRGPAGDSRENPGQNTSQMCVAEHQVMLLMGVDPSLDVSSLESVEEFAQKQGFVIALDAFDNEFIQQHADLVLPLATFLETSGTFVNTEGLWQPFKGVVSLADGPRPGWKVLTALGQTLLPGDEFSYQDSTQVRNELKELCRELTLDNRVDLGIDLNLPTKPRTLQKVSETAIYAVDAMTRNASPLQATPNTRAANSIRVNAAQAKKSKLEDAEQVHVQQGEGTAVLPLVIDDGVPDGCVWIPSGSPSVTQLGAFYGKVKVEKVS